MGFYSFAYTCIMHPDPAYTCRMEYVAMYWGILNNDYLETVLIVSYIMGYS